MLLKDLIENIGHTGGPSQARACLLLVEQLGSDLKELKSLEDAGSVHEARATLTRLSLLKNRSGRRWRNK